MGMQRIVLAAIAAMVLAFSATPARAQEAMVWAEAANNCDRLRAYAKNYPQGRFYPPGDGSAPARG
jgi:hypothetical protein